MVPGGVTAGWQLPAGPGVAAGLGSRYCQQRGQERSPRLAHPHPEQTHSCSLGQRDRSGPWGTAPRLPYTRNRLQVQPESSPASHLLDWLCLLVFTPKLTLFLPHSPESWAATFNPPCQFIIIMT